MSARHCTWWAGEWGFLARYPGGITLRLTRVVLIVRRRGYVPEWMLGWRKRIGAIEIHMRRVR